MKSYFGQGIEDISCWIENYLCYMHVAHGGNLDLQIWNNIIKDKHNNNYDVNIKWARNISQTNLSSLLSVATQSSAIKDWHAMYINPRVLFVMF